MPNEYHLEIYQPGNRRDVWVSFQSTSPFMPIAAGDLLNPGIWSGSESPRKLLRVVNVQHIIWENRGEAKQKIMIYSEEVENRDELIWSRGE
jgi:hypothetical protein